MNKNVVMLAGLVLMVFARFGFAGGLDKLLYVNRGLYDIESPYEKQIKVKSLEFEMKHPGELAKRNDLVSRVNELAEIHDEKLTNEQKKEFTEKLEVVKRIDSFLREIEQLSIASNVHYSQALESIINKTKADTIKTWEDGWYYLDSSYDVSDVLMDEVRNETWRRDVSAQKFKPKNIFYVSQLQLLRKFSSYTSMTTAEFSKILLSACKVVGEEVGADIITELSQGGVLTVRGDLNLTDQVGEEMLKLASR